MSAEPSSDQHMIDIDNQLIAAAKSEPTRTYRETIDESVRENLQDIIALAVAAGLTARPSGKRRLRAISISTWSLLESAESEVALSKVELIRAALVLQSRKHQEPGC
jgi:hypothetical protein